ncbi:MAG: hypothetical protein IKU03_06520 [Bacteroidales bacterium]|nr:hypothetical protein [Bacteroidales bacterium]
MANRGKKTCGILKEVRKTIAEVNHIPLAEHDCTHEGECRGTCPYCESQVRYLERELQRRKNLGKVVAVTGIAVSSMMMGACRSSGENPTPSTAERTETSSSNSPSVSSELSSNTNNSAEKTDPSSPNKKTVREVSLNPVEKHDTSNNTASPQALASTERANDPETFEWEGIVIELPDETNPIHWKPSIEGSLEDYLKERITPYASLKREPKYDDIYIVLIINEKGKVTDVMSQPGNVFTSSQEIAFFREVTKILKSMPNWTGDSRAGSSEIALSKLLK